MKKRILKKDIASASKIQKAVVENNRKITVIVASWFFTFFGRSLQEYSGRIPLALDKSQYTEDTSEYEKVKSRTVYTLTDSGVMPIHYTYGKKNEWTAPGFFGDSKLNLDRCSGTFITQKMFDNLNTLIQKSLNGILKLENVADIIEEDRWHILDIYFEEECDFV